MTSLPKVGDQVTIICESIIGGRLRWNGTAEITKVTRAGYVWARRGRHTVAPGHLDRFKRMTNRDGSLRYEVPSFFGAFTRLYFHWPDGLIQPGRKS